MTYNVTSNSLVIVLSVVLFAFSSCQFKSSDIENSPVGNRNKSLFNDEWCTFSGDIDNAYASYYDDSHWQEACWSHCINEVSGVRGNDESGVIWLRKHFDLKASDAGKKVFIEFESISKDAEVYVNSVFLGRNKSQNEPFAFDLTPYVVTYNTNLLAVRISDAKYARRRRRTHQNPVSHLSKPNDQPNGGNVFLYTMDHLYITLPIYDNMKTLGASVSVKSIHENTADVSVNVELCNEYPTAKSVSFETQIFNADGELVANVHSQETIGGDEKKLLKQSLEFELTQVNIAKQPSSYTVLHVIRNGELVYDTCRSTLEIDTNNRQTESLSSNDIY